MNDVFRIKINAKNKEELDFRISENKKRGFKLIKVLEVESSFKDYEYTTNEKFSKIKSVCNQINYKMKYVAIMEKENNKNNYQKAVSDVNGINIIEKLNEDECRKILLSYDFDKKLPDGKILLKFFYEHFKIKGKSLAPKLSGENRVKLGEDLIAMTYDESILYRKKLLSIYNYKVTNGRLTLITDKGVIKLLYILNRIGIDDINNILNEKTNSIEINKKIESNETHESDEDIKSLISKVLANQEILMRKINNIEVKIDRLESKDARKDIEHVKNLNKNINFTIDKKGNVIYK